MGWKLLGGVGLALAAAQPAFACVVGTMTPTGAVPVDGSELPADGRVVMVAGPGLGNEGSYFPFATIGGGLASGSFDLWCYGAAEAADAVTCWYVFEPAAALLPGAVLTVELRQDDPLGATVFSTTVTVADRSATPVGAAPALTLVDFAPEDLSDCAYGSGSTATLALEVDHVDPDGLSYVRILQLDDSGEVIVGTVVPTELAPAAFTVHAEGDGCFVAEYVDGAGGTARSAEACPAGSGSGGTTSGANLEDTDPGPFPNDEGSVACGCDAAGGPSAAGIGALGLLLGLARRRSRR